MCDFIPGEVIIAHHKDDSAGAAVIQQIREVGSPHFEFGGSLEDRLLQSEIPIRKNLQSKFYLVRVPAGNEAFKAEIFRFWYLHQVFSPEFWQGVKELPEFLRDSRLAFSVVPNSVLTGCFTFSQPHYQNYKRMFDWPGFSSTTKTVCVVDSGIESVSGFNIVSKHNFVDWTKRRDVTDEHPLQHGTAIAGIIRDMCPNSPLVIHKVLDKNNRASEWDTLAALAVNSGADIVT